MAIDGPKALRDARVASAVASRFARAAAFTMLCIIWGSTWLAIRIGLEGAPPFLAASLRFVVASATLLALTAVLRARWPRIRTEWALVGFVGLALFTANYGLIYWGENNGVESGLSAILFATYPLQTALVAHGLLEEEKLTLQKVLGIGMGFGGILVIFRSQLVSVGLDKAFPMLAIMLSATCAAFAGVAIKRWGHESNPVSFNAFAMGVGAVSLAATSFAAREPWSAPTWPEGIGAIVYLALLGSVVTFVTWQWLLKQAEVTSVSFVALITPIVAILLGATVGNESFDLVDLLGAAIVLIGIYVSISRRAAAWARAALGSGVIPDAKR
jgi:drug/metabolite transporter (DMT)-like permease